MIYAGAALGEILERFEYAGIFIAVCIRGRISKKIILKQKAKASLLSKEGLGVVGPHQL